MTKETMTIHEGLAELKILPDRIQKAVCQGKYCTANRHNNEKIGGATLEDYKAMVQGSYDKASGLIRRYTAIKRAITLSNAVTTVEIIGEKYTVAEAIYMKNTGMEYKEMLLNEMRRQYMGAQVEILENNGKKLEKKAEDYVVNLFGGKESKTSSDELDKARNSYIANYAYELVDPIGIQKKIEELEESISKFNAKVDAALSVSNAVTLIEIEY